MDVLLVIGAANSSNANRLVEVSTVMGTPSYLINDKNDIKPEWLDGSRRVGVTAGASTPEFLVTEVVEALQHARPRRGARGARGRGRRALRPAARARRHRPAERQALPERSGAAAVSE